MKVKHSEELAYRVSPGNFSGRCPCGPCEFVRQYNNEVPIPTDWAYNEEKWKRARKREENWKLVRKREEVSDGLC